MKREMRAVTYHQYGSSDVLQFEDIPMPDPKSDEVLIKVHAASVTTADWRIRSLEMPGVMKLIGRLMFGIFAPRNKVLGTDVAGDIVAIGSEVKRFQVGDAVFGHIGKGGHAQYAIAQEGAALLSKPERFSYPEAAALPFGALCSIVFLRDFAKLKSGQNILIIGASGNVGVYAVQIAKAFDANVTAVASKENSDIVSQLGADRFIDYKTVNLADLNKSFDVIFDTFGAMSFAQARKLLTNNGLFLPLNFSLMDALSNLVFGWMYQQKMITAVNGDNREDLQQIIDLTDEDKLTPVIDQIYSFEEIRQAYQHVEGRKRKGSIIVQIDNS